MNHYTEHVIVPGRAPHGARGLKRRRSGLPWRQDRRAPHGARGLKQEEMQGLANERGRAPHGARGLKRDWRRRRLQKLRSRPAWGAWIETNRRQSTQSLCRVAPRMGRVD